MTTELLLRPEIWIVFGLCLIALEMLIGFDYFVLPFGLSAILTGLLIFGTDFFAQTLQGSLIFFAVISVLILIPLKLIDRKKKNVTDINEY